MNYEICSFDLVQYSRILGRPWGKKKNAETRGGGKSHVPVLLTNTLGERIVFQNSEPWRKQSRGLMLFTNGANCETVTICFDKISYIELTKDVLKPASVEFVCLL
jgi:hypothetical protein